MPAPERETESPDSPNRDTESPPRKTTVPEPSPDNQDGKPDDNGNTSDTPQEGSDSGPADIGNLWSAIQSVASNVAKPQGPISTSPPTGPSGVEQAANNPPIFTFDGQTLSPGNAATFGGSPVSEAPDGDGVVIDGARTVLVSDGQATTVQQSGLGPLTVSRSGSILVVDGQTLSLANRSQRVRPQSHLLSQQACSTSTALQPRWQDPRSPSTALSTLPQLMPPLPAAIWEDTYTVALEVPKHLGARQIIVGLRTRQARCHLQDLDHG